MGRNWCVRAIARTAVTVALVAVVFVILGESRPARAGWSKFTSNSTWCQGTSDCPTLEASCENAADYMSFFNGGAPDDAAAIRTLNYYQAECLVYVLPPYGTTTAPTQNSCPSGYTQMLWADTGCAPYGTSPKKDCGADCDAGANNDVPAVVGNPVEPGSGRKSQRVVDFTTGGPNALAFIRYYDSMYTDYALSATNKYALGFVWHSNFHSPKVFLMPGTSNLYVVERANGQLLLFQWLNGAWTPDRDIPTKLTGSSSTGWTFTDWNDQVTTYATNGRLASIRERNGYLQTLAYDANGRLATVTDSYGRQLSFAYYGAGMLATMTAPGGRVYRYSYDAAYVTGNPYYADRLIKVTYPDDTPAVTTDDPFVRYLYGIPGYRYMLTGIIDEKGNQLATFGYRSDGVAAATEHAGGADRTTVTYLAGGVRTITNPLDQQHNYAFSFVLYPPVGGASYGGFSGMPKVTRMDRTANAGVPAASASWTYDGNGYIASHTDWNGHQTTWVRNTQGLETSRTEAAGTPQARTIATTWHATFRVPTQVVAPGKTTAFTYDTSGRVLTRTETDTTTQTVPYSTNGQTRTWTYTWDATGLLLSVNGPLSGAGDTTTFTWTNGNLTRVTNALGQATDILAYDPRGLPTQVRDPNGAVTDLTYDARGRLLGVIRRAASGDATTSFAYDAAGLLTRMTLPDGSYLDYSYDAAHRLTAVTNNLGERIEYSLDLMGNRTAETIRTAAGGTITKTMTRAYDQLGRLLRSIGAANQTTAYAYDHEGNVVSLTDPLNGLTTQAYDALDRLIQSTDATRTGLTDYGYDTRDNLTEVTDPRGIATAYVYNGFGEAIQAASPDAGTTVYRYDAAGRLTEATDGRNVTTQYAYDNLNRVTAKSFPHSRGENVTYAYDDPTAGSFGIGRLTRIVDESGTTSFAYDARGNLRQRGWTPAGTTLAYTTAYAYDLADRLTQVVYPSGRIMDYGRDSLGRVASATTRANAAATPVTLVSGLAYKPLGPLAAASFGNGLAAALDYDLDYRLTSLVTGDVDTFVQNLAYGYDNADDILTITDAIAAGRSQSFQYDPLFRLTRGQGAYGTIDYGYDAVGNRTSLIQASATDTYVYDAFSNRLASVTSGGIIRQFTYDGAGNTTADSGGGVNLAFAYNDANRMKQATAAGATTLYTYNALGQRAIKSPSGKNVPAAQKTTSTLTRTAGCWPKATAPERSSASTSGSRESRWPRSRPAPSATSTPTISARRRS